LNELIALHIACRKYNLTDFAFSDIIHYQSVWEARFNMGRLNISLLDSNVDFGSFDCGNQSINESVRNSYFVTLIMQGHAYGISVNGKIVGSYLLRIVSVENYSGEYDTGRFDARFAALKLEYIAISKEYQRRGIGSLTFDIILKQVKDISVRLPIRYMTLDSFPDKVSWYANFGLIYYPEKTDNTSDTTTMYLDFINDEAIEQYHRTMI
jgi:GNAT superfamily N-acetyltransferase